MKIEKLADNQVRVIKQKKTKDTNNKDVYIDDEPIEYGQKKVDNEREMLQGMIDFYNDPKKIADEIANLQQRLSDLNLIEQELNK